MEYVDYGKNVNTYLLYTDIPEKLMCEIHDDYSNYGYYCKKCKYFVCSHAVNLDIDKE